MTENPFDKAEPAVIPVGRGGLGLCPCGWRSQVFKESPVSARAELDGHIRSVHPERWRFGPTSPPSA